MKLANFLCCYFNLPFCFSRGGSFTDDHPDSSRPQTASSSRSDLVYSGRQQKSWKFDGYSSDNDVMPCVHCKAAFTLFRTACRATIRYSVVGREDLVVWIPVLTSEYLLLSQWVPFTSATVRIPVSHYTKVWHRTLPICDAPPSRSARRRFAPLQESRRNHCSHVWTESLFSKRFSCRRNSYPVRCEHSLKIFLHV